MTAASKKPRARRPAKTSARTKPAVVETDDAHRSAVAAAIATELAPEVAIALLAKTEQAPGADAAALVPIAAGVSASDDDDKIRVKLLFENGAVLPVELARHAGEALIRGLEDELHPNTKPSD